MSSHAIGSNVETTMTAAGGALQVLADSGIDAMFGNPGTTEIPLLKELGREDSPVRYVLALHEGTAVSAAMGYALVSGRPGVALVHAMPGIANGLSQYFNAFRSGVPLVLLAGQQDRRHQHLNPILQADMVDVLRSVSKSVWEAKTAAEVPAVLANALTQAARSPSGPVFLSIPVDLWDQPVSTSKSWSSVSRHNVGAARQDEVATLAQLIADADAPVFVAGDKVGWRGCGQQLAELAELSGATAYWMPGSSLANFPTTSGANRGLIFPNSASFARAFGGADLVVFFGAEFQAPILFSSDPLVPPHARTASLSETPADPLGAFTPDLVTHGDLLLTIDAVTDAVRGQLGDGERSRVVADRCENIVSEGLAQRERLRARSLPAADDAALTGRQAIATVFEAAPDDVMVVDESVSNAWVSLLGEFADPHAFLAPGRGGSLGLALGVGVGAQIARPERPVLAFVGDGAAIYAVQGLWTLAHERLPVVVCVLNNSGYSILKDFLDDQHFTSESTSDTPTVGELAMLSIEGPAIDMVDLARSFGVDSTRVEDASSCRDAVKRAFASGHPWLIDITLEPAKNGSA